MNENDKSNKEKIISHKMLVVLIVFAVISILMSGILIALPKLKEKQIELAKEKTNNIKQNYTTQELSENQWDISATKNDHVIATLSEDGILTISGTGNMKKCYFAVKAPWNNVKNNIKRVNIENGVTNIGDYIFYECENLTSINIPQGVTSIGEWAFNHCSSITNITIPNTVTNMGTGAFSKCTSLTNINIPSGVTVIQNQLFDGCSSLTKIEIPESVTQIKNYAFVECTSLETIEIPDTVTSISSRIFQYCQRLKNIRIPQNANCDDELFFHSVLQIWTTIGEGTEQEILLPDIITRAKNEEDNLYTEREFTYLNCKISEDNTKLILNTQDLKDGNEVGIKINEGPLQGLTVRIMLPEVIWDISKSENSNVKAIFKYNEKLLTISGNGEMKDFGWDCGPWYYLRDYIENVTIEYGVTSIGTYCFFDNPGVSNINLPETIKLIAPYAFRGCKNLENINIPEGTQMIGTGVFSACNNLKEVNISSTVFAIGLDNVTMEWNEGMLEGLKITSTGEVFKQCSNLKNINVNSNNKYYSSDDGILYDKSKSSLVIYPAGKENEAFEIPNTVTEICADAFDSCMNLQSVEIPGTVEEIKNQCFSGSNIRNVILNEGLKRIGEYAFYENDKIEEIYIPSSVESIGKGALCKMESLKNIEVSLDNEVYTSENGILFSKDKSKLIQYPANKVGDMYMVQDTVESIETGAFAYGNNLKYLKINDNTSKIGTSAFVFSNLIGIYIPNSVETISVFNVAGDITPFYGSEDYTIYCNDDSYAKDFCVKYSLNYSTNTEEILEKFATKVLEGIEATTAPNKTEYIEGQNFNPTGMVITATYNDGSTKEVTDYTITDGTNLTTGKTNVTISYTEKGVTKTATQEITVIAKALTGIEVTTPPNKTEYIEGQNFDKTGMVVTATYNDGSTKEVTNYTVTDGENLPVGKTSVTISYTENGVTKTATVEIKVTAIERYFRITKYVIKDNYIRKITPKTLISDFIKNIQTNMNYVIKEENKEVESTSIMKTGQTITVGDKTYTIIVIGDLNKDGKIDVSELAKIAKIGAGKITEMTEIEKMVIDVDMDGEIKINDLAAISKYASQ